MLKVQVRGLLKPCATLGPLDRSPLPLNVVEERAVTHIGK